MPPEVPSSSITQSDVPPVVAELPSEADPKTPEEPPRNDMEPSEPPVGDPGEQDLATGGDPTHPALEPNQSQPDVDDTVAAGPSSPEGDDEDALAGHSCGFASPGEDVPYRPTASFSGEDDFAYALPPDDAGRPTFLASLFDFAESAEVIDPEAMYKELSEPLGEGGPALREIDFLVRRASDSGRLDPKAAEPAYSKGEVSVNPEPDEDEALNSALTTVHDADV